MRNLKILTFLILVVIGGAILYFTTQSNSSVSQNSESTPITQAGDKNPKLTCD
jgi:hypothetical protein